MRCTGRPLALALTLSLLAGIGLVLASCTPIGGPSPDTLLVSSTIPEFEPQFHPKLIHQTVNEPTGVQHLYAEIYDLPNVPSGPVNCAKDYGLRYTLTFQQAGKSVLTVTANPNGCAFVRLSATDARAPTLDFWGDLAALLGRPLYDVYVLPMYPTPGPTMTACDTPTPAP